MAMNQALFDFWIKYVNMFESRVLYWHGIFKNWLTTYTPFRFTHFSNMLLSLFRSHLFIFCIVLVRQMANSLSLHTHFYTIAFHTIWLKSLSLLLSYFSSDFPVRWIKKDGGCRSSCTTILLLCLIKPQYHPQLNCASKITEHTVKIGPFFVPLLKVSITLSNCVWNTKWMLHILHILPQ